MREIAHLVDTGVLASASAETAVQYEVVVLGDARRTTIEGSLRGGDFAVLNAVFMAGKGALRLADGREVEVLILGAPHAHDVPIHINASPADLGC